MPGIDTATSVPADSVLEWGECPSAWARAGPRGSVRQESGMFTTRVLTPDDLEPYLALRAEMLEDSPHAFASSLGDDPCEEEEAFLRQLGSPERFAIVACEVDASSGAFVACAGIFRSVRIKSAHRATIWGVYGSPGYRRRGLTGACLEFTLDIARSWPGVEVVGLSCSEHSPEALRLYRRLGFEPWGREPDALRLGDRSYDEIHMQRVL